MDAAMGRHYLSWGNRAILAAMEVRLNSHEAYCREERARFERLIEKLDLEQDRRHSENLRKFDKINYIIASAIGGGIVIAAVASLVVHAIMAKLGLIG